MASGASSPSSVAYTPGRVRALAWGAVLGVVALAFALRGWCLREPSLGSVEAFSWRLASFPWVELLQRAKLDNNPPFYYLLLKVWILKFGDSVAAIRSLSMLAGALSCVGVYVLVIEAYGRSGAVALPRARSMAACASALVATNALQVRMGSWVRMYALGAALAVFSAWLLLRALHATVDLSARGPAARNGLCGAGLWSRWLVYLVVALPFAYTHTYAPFSLAAQTLFAVGFLLAQLRRGGTRIGAARLLGAPVVSFALLGAGWAPWIPVLRRQETQVEKAFNKGPFTRRTIPKACLAMFVDPLARPMSDRIATIAAAACGALLLALLWRPSEGDWLVLASAALPVALALVAAVAAGTNVVQPNYLAFAEMFLLVAATRVLFRMPCPAARACVLALVLTNSVALHADAKEATGAFALSQEPRAGRASAYVESKRAPGEPVVISHLGLYLVTRYNLGDDPDCRLLRPERRLFHYEGTAALRDDDFVERADLAKPGARRLWLVSNAAVEAPAAAVTAAGWHEMGRVAFYDEGMAIVVVEYVRP